MFFLDAFGDLNAPYLVGCGLLIGAVLLVHAAHAILTWSAPPLKHKLVLRKLQKSGDKMLGGNECNNIFTEEYNLLTDLLFPKVDFCVMKNLDHALPILSKQEQLHAKMHAEGKQERKRLLQQDSMARWAWFVNIADFLLLRCGRQVGCAIAGYAEATSGLWFYWPMSLPFTKGFMSDEYVFHALEELEHGPLTTEYLRTQVSVLSPLLFLPVAILLFFVYFLFPPVMVILMTPTELLNPKNVIDLVRYYCSFVPTFIFTIYACVMYWVLPFTQNHTNHTRQYQFFQTVCQERGIKFDIVDEVTYSVRGKVVTTHKED